ncbi:hypothetical protein PILCRDRAFT_93195 [Piloderma croceum F 1598]|uniref:Uncharacterized protein n=1 Tax=Piloderma croceum (strain F 1598) TaxID=765440 RepID=A0A0C3AH52_PILCF|nr:hypothetical protein PILCRDRAFT_93195 [Piloderma croceum F 1598]
MTDLSIVLQELQAMRRDMSREQADMREEFKREQQLLADQFVGLVNNFSMLGDDLHASFRNWREECKERVVEKVAKTLIPRFEVLMGRISQICSCDCPTNLAETLVQNCNPCLCNQAIRVSLDTVESVSSRGTGPQSVSNEG